MNKFLLCAALIISAGCASSPKLGKPSGTPERVSAQDKPAVLTAALDSGYLVRLFEAPCTHMAIVAMLDKDIVPLFQAGESFSQEKKRFELCWMPQPNGTIFVVDETGDHGVIPIGLFERI